MKIYKRWKDLSLKLNIRPPKKQTITQKNKYVMLFFALFMFLYHPCYAASDTRLKGDDHTAGPFPIGFTFKYYNNSFNQFYVTTNGLLQFTDPTPAYLNSCLPAKKNTLYVFWDDLRTDVPNQQPGTIMYETQGEAPNRKLIVQWTNQYFFGSNIPMGTFQAILYEGSNQIKYQYRNLLDDRSKGSSATIGIQSANTDYMQIGCDQKNTIEQEQAILFIPNDDFSQYQVDMNAPYNFIDISGLKLNKPISIEKYTNHAPIWSWQKNSTLNNYEIDIQDYSGNTVHREVIGNVEQYVFETSLQNGQSCRARIRGSINDGKTWELWSDFSTLVTIDTINPVIKLQQFNRINDDTVKVIFSTEDNLSGIESGHLQIANTLDFQTILIDQDIDTNKTSFLVSNLPFNNNKTLYARLTVKDKAGNESGYSEPLLIDVKAPVIIQPVAKSTIKTSTLNLQGKAESTGKVQFYLNGNKVGNPVVIDEDGYFSTVINLKTEGNYQLTAKLINDFVTNKQSQPVSFSFKLPIPTATFITPVQNQEILAPFDIQVIATDETGIDKVEVYLDDKLFATLTEIPYQVHWPLTIENNGKHTLKVKATNINGKVAITERTISVNVEPPAPAPTIYTGKVTDINPKVSYGPQPITITGQAIYRMDNTVVANVPLKLVLKVNNFERKIAIATDDRGNFTYTFIPQETDNGVYQVTIIHPDEKIKIPQDSFEINQVTFNHQNYQLRAARNVATTINLNATTVSAVKNLHWILTEENQPNGILPKGIKIESEAYDIGEGKTESTMIDFIADDTAPTTGSIYLVALADDSKDLIRGKVKIDYQLEQAKPALYATPNSIQTGLQQGSIVSANISLGNKGLAEAKNVQIQLIDENNNPAPSWLFIASDKIFESIGVNQQVPIQIVAQPDQTIMDGIYQFNLKISVNNHVIGTIPVRISVTQSQQGSVQFDIADIYTATLDKHNQPIPGVNGATIKLQNEAVLTEEYSLKSNNQGIALLENIPTGIYRYRVSAPNHMDMSGRIIIHPNSITNEHVFLEYQTINIELGVTETIINDIYDIELNATFNTLVPAPVVLIEPLSINLGYLQFGEEKVGELTVTNYGLIEAKNVVLHLPKTDNNFKYEFFGEVPTSLLPKEKRVISYRVTALDPNNSNTIKIKDAIKPKSITPKEANSCYLVPYSEKHNSFCANGDTSSGGSGGYFYKNTGSCGTGKLGTIQGLFGEGIILSPLTIPLAPGCSPQAACAVEGAGSGAE